MGLGKQAVEGLPQVLLCVENRDDDGYKGLVCHILLLSRFAEALLEGASRRRDRMADFERVGCADGLERGLRHL